MSTCLLSISMQLIWKDNTNLAGVQASQASTHGRNWVSPVKSCSKEPQIHRTSYVKQTHNDHSFAGSVQNLTPGVFVCVVGGLPLFTTQHLSPSTASSGWLSFSQPVSDDHIQLIHPDANSPDQRVEVVCAKSRCHLGHYFGKGNGYCSINASVLNFVEATDMVPTDVKILSPQSWLALEESTLLHATLKRLMAQGVWKTKPDNLGIGCNAQ